MQHNQLLGHLRRGATLVAIVAASACGAFHRGSNTDAYVQFVTQANDQADVYAIPVAGDPVRIGTVFAGRTTQLTVPATAIGGDGTVDIVARIFAGNRAPRTGRISLSPGQSVQVTLPPEENTLSVLPATGP